jgi:hypothetical protein
MKRAPVQSESQIVADIRLALGKRTDCIAFRNAVGAYKTKSGHTIKYGLIKSSSDLVVICKPSGRWCVLEVKKPGWKRPRNKHERDQAAFIEMVKRAGGHGAFVTSVEEAELAIEEAIFTADGGAIDRYLSRVAKSDAWL